jgi:hypothetical protein
MRAIGKNHTDTHKKDSDQKRGPVIPHQGQN